METIVNIPLKYDNISWVFFVSYNIICLTKVSVASVGLLFLLLSSAMITFMWKTFAHLWMIGWLSVVENGNNLRLL